MSKDVYLAGRLDIGEITIGSFAKELETRGHNVLEQWWQEGRLPKPYLDNPATSSPAAKKMIEAAYKSDVFILFPTDDILGAAVEFGAALGSSMAMSEKEIIVVGPKEVRQSVFYAHPEVVALEVLEQVRTQNWY